MTVSTIINGDGSVLHLWFLGVVDLTCNNGLLVFKTQLSRGVWQAFATQRVNTLDSVLRLAFPCASLDVFFMDIIPSNQEATHDIRNILSLLAW
jgi:hypothetical protein